MHLHGMSETNFVAVKFLMKFLCSVADKSEINKMTISNLAVVFGPSLLWPQDQVSLLLLKQERSHFYCVNAQHKREQRK